MTLQKRKQPLQFVLEELVRPGGYAVFALDKHRNLLIAQFPESVSPNMYQSPAEAKMRAKMLLVALREKERNEHL